MIDQQKQKFPSKVTNKKKWRKYKSNIYINQLISIPSDPFLLVENYFVEIKKFDSLNSIKIYFYTPKLPFNTFKSLMIDINTRK